MASFCLVPSRYLSASVESSGSLLLVSNHTFWPLPCLVEEVFIPEPSSYLIVIRLQLFTYQCGLLKRCLPVLELLNVLGLGLWPNIIYKYVLLGLSTLHNVLKNWIKILVYNMQVFSIWKFCFECAITSYLLGLSDCPLGFKKEKIDVTLYRNITLL